jgi:hypothetical protein
MNNRRSFGIVLVVASVVTALIVFVGFGVPPAMGHSAVHLDAAGNTLSRSDSIHFHWSAITLAVLFVVGLLMAVLPKRSNYVSDLAVF